MSLGPSEILLVLLAILLLFGGKRLPEVARNLGRGLAEIRRVTFDMKRQLNADVLETPPPSSNTVSEKTSSSNKPSQPVNVHPAAQPRTSSTKPDSTS
jgi:TatA/E family protein of Tat protein translocase